MKQLPKSDTTQKGFALILALIISSVVLAIGVSILNISINQISLSATARESEFAFQAAHAGIDCLQYWRGEQSAGYLAGSNQTISCFEVSPSPTAMTVVKADDGSSVAYKYSNTFQWGTPERCTSVDMFVMRAYGADLTLPFTNKAVGTNGSKTCKNGNVCTVIVSDGYNRACNEIGTSIFSVQRELTLEF
jgi:Tfp pilus assembly protein PilV